MFREDSRIEHLCLSSHGDRCDKAIYGMLPFVHRVEI